ncbi:hypothetical protein RF11_05932 [Thelohanellus kitauei]|uniref:Uncharacterized protein n=1 Tax=Thelohanellus kitauei TaxID=669202 RepID=A0A0C2NDJ7_THEKT|nr:hypothetical protein RF11_05932 [Thelohanellus kitauei]
MSTENLQTMPGGRVDHDMVSVRQFLVICGGYDCMSGAVCDDLLIYNTISCVWKRYQPPIELEKIVRYDKICAFDNKVYICGIEHPLEIVHHIKSLVSFDVTNSK